MKRIFTLLLTLIVIVSVLAVSVSASNIPNNANTDYESGRLYNKIIYWQDYVTSSNEGTLPNVSGSAAGQTGWVTSVELPGDSLWDINDGGGSLGQIWYTNSSYSGTIWLDTRDISVTWRMPYFISLEDLRIDEASVFRLSVQNTNGIGFSSVAVYAEFFDLYKNSLGIVDLSHTLGNGGSYVSTVSEFYLSEEFIKAGAQYVKFSADINFSFNESLADVALTVTDWQLLLPFKFDPELFAVDGFDAWMNGYFRPIVPDMDEAGDIYDYLDDSALLFHKILNDVEAFFLSLKDCFSAWNWIWGRFLKVDWISQLLNVCFAFGAFAFLLDISVNVGRTVSGRIKNARSKDGKQTQTSRNNTKKKGDL